MQQPSILCIVLANGAFVEPAVTTKFFTFVFFPALLTRKAIIIPIYLWVITAANFCQKICRNLDDFLWTPSVKLLAFTNDR